MTGDEWPAIGRLITEHVLPRLREHGIRWIQVARTEASQADGIIILNDSCAPREVHLGGAYKLSDEMLAVGIVSASVWGSDAKAARMGVDQAVQEGEPGECWRRATGPG